jgi:hypothetical protein
MVYKINIYYYCLGKKSKLLPLKQMISMAQSRERSKCKSTLLKCMKNNEKISLPSVSNTNGPSSSCGTASSSEISNHFPSLVHYDNTSSESES